jgi:hypothetical protein
VNAAKWAESVLSNQSKTELYTVQINSVDDLLERIKKAKEVSIKAQERLKNVQAYMNKLKAECDEDLQCSLGKVKKINEVIVS